MLSFVLRESRPQGGTTCFRDEGAKTSTLELSLTHLATMLKHLSFMKHLSSTRNFPAGGHGWRLLPGLLLLASSAFAAELTIERVEPTPLFPKQPEGRPLKQLARLGVNNPGASFAATARIKVGTDAPYTVPLNEVRAGQSTNDIYITDLSAPAPLTVELLDKDGVVLGAKKLEWQPQKKWTIFGISYSHQDLGFGDYPHRLRTSIRRENIRLPLRFCRETDAWPAADQYRFNIETSEPITSFISFHGKEAARELAQRLREGRISLGGLHNTANTEQLSHELLARLFYMSGRHAVDLLGAPPNKTMQNDDVIGQTWPLATFGAEAGLSYFFHGYNGCGHCFQPAESEPVFYWQGPDGQRVLVRSTAYGGYAGDGPGDGSEAHIMKMIRRLGANCPYDTLLIQEGTDFQLATRTLANQIHAWNARWAWPRMVCGTFDMFFERMAAQTDAAKVKTFAADANNQWSDQDYAAARATAQARRLSEALPATETLASVAQALAGGGDQWINLWQGYHRLLQYFEHTNAKDNPRGNMAWYETELEENREMTDDAAACQQQAFASVSRRLAGVITRSGDRNLVVFNSLPTPRTDVVRAAIPAAELVDAVTGARVPVQQLPDGSAIFVARNVPATGYRTYALEGTPVPVSTAEVTALESPFYRIRFHPTNGVLTSLFDKTLGVEWVDTNAPHAFNEYLYEFRTHANGLDYSSVWSRMERADSIQVVRGPVADVLTVAGKAGGVRALRQTVILHHHLSRVDFAIGLDKAPFGGAFPRQHEAVFVALPFNLPKFSIHHELPGAVIEPCRQQFTGSATDHYAIRSFADFSSDKHGVTVSPVEGSLVCYGEPISSPILYGHEDHFKRDQTYPKHSRLYLYLLNNMFDVNIAADQQGPVSFHWSLRSHAGDWKAGGAAAFGRVVQQPLLAWRADGRNAGPLPASASFMSVDASNVTCSVIKPAEANGRGFILRFHETTGAETTATVSLPMLPAIESVKETSLVENDRAGISHGNTFKVALHPFGVKTVRVTCAAPPQRVYNLDAKSIADLQVDLSWQPDGQNLSHFNLYRDTAPDCAPTPLNFIGQSATGNYSDRPQIHAGGWLRSCLTPNTTYYYRVVPVDRANNPGTPSAAVAVTTPSSAQANLPPVAVEGLRAMLVSPISRDNFINLLFRTACEPDVVRYEIHRGLHPGFAAGPATLIGTVKSDDLPPRSGGYGESAIQYTVKEYDHATFADKTVEPSTTYYYRVRAVDAAGQKGTFSEEVSVRTKEPFLGGFKLSAQSVYALDYDVELALDGDSDPYQAWISKPYGGGTKEKPLDVWWAVEFPKATPPIAGVKIIGDHRPEIPLQTALQVHVREDGAWKTIAEAKNAADKDMTVKLSTATPLSALRIFIPAADLPRSKRPDVDGIVRICELKLILPDGTEANPKDLFAGDRAK